MNTNDKIKAFFNPNLKDDARLQSTNTFTSGSECTWDDERGNDRRLKECNTRAANMQRHVEALLTQARYDRIWINKVRRYGFPNRNDK